MEEDSHLLTQDATNVIPVFAMDELKMGKVLGRGGFGTVKEIRAINCRRSTKRVSSNGEDISEHDNDQAFQDKKFIADHCIRNGGDSRYCIKVSLFDSIITSLMYCIYLFVGIRYIQFFHCILSFSPDYRLSAPTS